ARGAKIQLLGVRTRREFAHGHITGAVNVPIQSFRRELPLLDLGGSKPVVTICKTAHRSPAATRLLRAQGSTLFSWPTAWMNRAARNSLSRRRDAGARRPGVAVAVVTGASGPCRWIKHMTPRLPHRKEEEIMSTFTHAETHYLSGQPLGRIATVGPH